MKLDTHPLEQPERSQVFNLRKFFNWLLAAASIAGSYTSYPSLVSLASRWFPE
jgi:hypothetical protein